MAVLVDASNICDSAGHLSTRPHHLERKFIYVLSCELCRNIPLCCTFLLSSSRHQIFPGYLYVFPLFLFFSLFLFVFFSIFFSPFGGNFSFSLSFWVLRGAVSSEVFRWCNSRICLWVPLLWERVVLFSCKMHVFARKVHVTSSFHVRFLSWIQSELKLNATQFDLWLVSFTWSWNDYLQLNYSIPWDFNPPPSKHSGPFYISHPIKASITRVINLFFW